MHIAYGILQPRRLLLAEILFLMKVRSRKESIARVSEKKFAIGLRGRFDDIADSQDVIYCVEAHVNQDRPRSTRQPPI